MQVIRWCRRSYYQLRRSSNRRNCKVRTGPSLVSLPHQRQLKLKTGARRRSNSQEPRESRLKVEIPQIRKRSKSHVILSRSKVLLAVRTGPKSPRVRRQSRRPKITVPTEPPSGPVLAERPSSPVDGKRPKCASPGKREGRKVVRPSIVSAT